MPNISFDIFYNPDIINFTASRSNSAPRVKPDWKVRQAPKLAPRQTPTPASTFGRKQNDRALESSKPAAEKSKPETSNSRSNPAPKRPIGSSVEKEESQNKPAIGTRPPAPKIGQAQNKKTPPKLNKLAAGKSAKS